MKKMITPGFIALIVTASMMLTGCGYTVSQLVRNDDLRHKVLKDCALMGASAVTTDKCQKATEAQARVAGKAVGDLLK